MLKAKTQIQQYHPQNLTYHDILKKNVLKAFEYTLIFLCVCLFDLVNYQWFQSGPYKSFLCKLLSKPGAVCRYYISFTLLAQCSLCLWPYVLHTSPRFLLTVCASGWPDHFNGLSSLVGFELEHKLFTIFITTCIRSL